MEHAVNAPPRAELFDLAGHSVQVPESEVGYWLSQGFSRDAGDLDALAAELPALFASCARAVTDYVNDVKSSGLIDTNGPAKTALEMGLTELHTKLSLLRRAVDARFDVKQEDGELQTITSADVGQIN